MKQRKNSSLVRFLFLFILIATVIWLSGRILTRLCKGITSDSTTQDNPSWQLILVNKEHPIPENYSVDLTTLANGEQVDSRIYPELQQMFDDARANGLGLFVASGYRSHKEQVKIFEEKMNAFLSQGYSKKKALSSTASWVAVPGTSEHELGIAVDINTDLSISTRESVYTWLAENSYKYGFILRYPPEKADITGVQYEPWHYRYVGKEAAQDMFDRNLCLEEYLGIVKSGK